MSDITNYNMNKDKANGLTIIFDEIEIFMDELTNYTGFDRQSKIKDTVGQLKLQINDIAELVYNQFSSFMCTSDHCYRKEIKEAVSNLIKDRFIDLAEKNGFDVSELPLDTNNKFLLITRLAKYGKDLDHIDFYIKVSSYKDYLDKKYEGMKPHKIIEEYEKTIVDEELIVDKETYYYFPGLIS